MAVSRYEKYGETLWKIYINLRSKADPTIRVQKLLIGFKSKAKAEIEMVSEEVAKAQDNLAVEKRRYGLIRVTKTCNKRTRTTDPTKGGYYKT